MSGHFHGVKRLTASGAPGICLLGLDIEVAESEWQDEPGDQAKADRINDLLSQRGAPPIVWADVTDGLVTVRTGKRNDGEG